MADRDIEEVVDAYVSDLDLVHNAVERMTKSYDKAVIAGWPERLLFELIMEIAATVKEIEIYLTKQSTPQA